MTEHGIMTDVHYFWAADQTLPLDTG